MHERTERVDEPFRGLLLRYRGRTSLTQALLATGTGVHLRSIQAWEAGASFPRSDRLQALIACLFGAGGFAVGREAVESAALWSAVDRESLRPLPPFDSGWFADLAAARVQPAAPERLVSRSAVTHQVRTDGGIGPRSQDWGDAPDTHGFLGRASDLDVLTGWVVRDSARLLVLRGMGGIGKTMLAARLARDLASFFQCVYWRSVRNAPTFAEWSTSAIAFVSDQQRTPPDADSDRLDTLVQLLRERRCLLVLDNLESLLQPGVRQSAFRPEYTGYGTLVRILGESQHASCLLLTSRETPPGMADLSAQPAAVHELELSGLDATEAQQLLKDKHLTGDEASWTRFVLRYGGNGLALKVVGESIHQVFGGDVAAFMDQVEFGMVFGGIRRLLDSQFERLSPVEQDILYLLAIEREPVSFVELVTDMGPRARRSILLEALEALRHRSLVEPTDTGATFTLQSAVLEYITDRLMALSVAEIQAGHLDLLARRPLLKAQAKEYVLRSQERLLGQPTLERLVESNGDRASAEQRLLELLEQQRARPLEEHAYGPGNLVNLLRLLRGDLRGVDMSNLDIRQAFMRDIEAQDASLAGAQLGEAVLAEAFASPNCLALSADMTYLVAGTSRGAVCLWSLWDRRLLLSIPAHVGQTYGIALSEDASLVVSGSLDETEAVKLWAIPSGRLVATMRSGGGAWGVALSADGQMVASGHVDHTVKLWTAHTGQLVRTLEGHDGAVYGVKLSLDRQRVFSGSQDGTVRVWEAATGRLQRTLVGHTESVTCVAVSADRLVVASGSLDNTVKLWHVATGELLMTFVGHTGGVFGVSLTPDRRLLASASLDGLIKVWDSVNGQLLATLQGHASGAGTVALTSDGSLVASGSQDGHINVWESASGRLVTTLQGHTTQLYGVALSEDTHQVVSGAQDGTVKVWDTASGRLLTTLRQHASRVHCVALSEDGRLAASGSLDQTVNLWDPESGRLLRTLSGHTGAVYGVALSGDAQVLASGGFDGTANLWDVHSGRLLAALPHSATPVLTVSLTRDASLLASGTRDGLVRLWDVQNTQLLTTFSGDGFPVRGVALSADRQRLAIGYRTGMLEFWDVAPRHLLATMVGHSGGIWSLALSTDGQLLISGGQDRSVKLWDTRRGQVQMTLTGHTGPIWGVALSTDARLAASASEDGTVKLWEVNTGACLRTLRAERRYERMDITGLSGVTEAQRAALLELGAIERPNHRPHAQSRNAW